MIPTLSVGIMRKHCAKAAVFVITSFGLLPSRAVSPSFELYVIMRITVRPLVLFIAAC